MMVVFTYLVYLIFRMYRLDDDDYKQMTMVNPMDTPELKQILWDDMNFMPSFEIRASVDEKALEEFDIYDTAGLDR